MTNTHARATRLAAALLATCLLASAGATAAEKKKAPAPGAPSAWKPLFDGKSLAGWKANEATESFTVMDGAIVANGKPRSHLFYVGDDQPFVDFELEADVMTRPNSNGGIYFHTAWQEAGWPRQGFEVQVNNTYKDKNKTASLYEVVNVTEPPAADDKWFKLGIKVQGKRVVTSVDGKVLVDYTEPAGKQPGKDFTRVLDRGTFALQAHDAGSTVLFKNLRVRRLAAASGAEGEAIVPKKRIALWNGKDLGGWTADVPAKDTDPNVPDSFVVRDGLLVSRGTPGGHLMTNATYRNYRLEVEYRFPDKGGNCGVLVHASRPRALYKMFPQSIEVQMMHENAGDFWCIEENIEVPDMEARRPRKEPGQRFGGGPQDARRIVNLTDGSEKPLGQWNQMVIEARDRGIKVWVNGQLVNDGQNATTDRGKIALQAEGTEVEFRKVVLLPLKAAKK
jgi:hypothetical protein